MNFDRYWRSLLFIFREHAKLSRYLTNEFFDLQNEEIDVQKLKRVSKPWSTSEKFMLNLALHLFNERNKVNLSDLDRLDERNKSIALKAINIRFL